MLTVQRIRADIEAVKQGLRRRNYDEATLSIIDRIISVDDERKTNQTLRDESQAKINTLSKEIGKLYQSGQATEAQALKKEVTSLKDITKTLEHKQSDIEDQLIELLLSVPNIPHQSVPQGHDETDNIEVYRSEYQLDRITDGLPHWDLAKQYNLIDFDLGVKVTGSGFPLYRGKGARLERALINYFLDQASNAGYEEIAPPLLVNEDSARATGQIPDKEGQMYHCEKDDLYLIPTAEVPVTNIYRNVIINETELPIKLAGYTPCFRREAGSYGADVKGLNRVHQFDKVEIVQISTPESSYRVLDEMVDHVKELMNALELPYRILRLCGGDLGFTSALTYDFEVYSAAQDKWLEVSSVSNFETYQSNRLKLRYRDADGKKHLAHTLNGSALALARIVAALLENKQTTDGIKIPKVLVPYTRFELIK